MWVGAAQACVCGSPSGRRLFLYGSAAEKDRPPARMPGPMKSRNRTGMRKGEGPGDCVSPGGRLGLWPALRPSAMDGLEVADGRRDRYGARGGRVVLRVFRLLVASATIKRGPGPTGLQSLAPALDGGSRKEVSQALDGHPLIHTGAVPVIRGPSESWGSLQPCRPALLLFSLP